MNAIHKQCCVACMLPWMVLHLCFCNQHTEGEHNSGSLVPLKAVTPGQQLTLQSPQLVDSLINMLSLEPALKAVKQTAQADTAGGSGGADSAEAQAAAASAAETAAMTAGSRPPEERQQRLASCVQGAAVALSCLLCLAQQRLAQPLLLLQAGSGGADLAAKAGVGAAQSGQTGVKALGGGQLPPRLLALLQHLGLLLEDDVLAQVRALLHATRMAAAAAVARGAVGSDVTWGVAAAGPGASAESQESDRRDTMTSCESTAGAAATSGALQQAAGQQQQQQVQMYTGSRAWGVSRINDTQAPYSLDVRLAAAELIVLGCGEGSGLFRFGGEGHGVPPAAAGAPVGQAGVFGGSSGDEVGVQEVQLQIGGIQGGLEGLMADQDAVKRGMAIQVGVDAYGRYRWMRMGLWGMKVHVVVHVLVG